MPRGDVGHRHGDARLPPVFSGVLPAVARWAVGPERAGPDDLLPEETMAVAAAVPSRVEEFATGRVAARAALDALGVAPAAIPADSSRRPVWPDGVVGSITHCRGVAAAAVARAGDLHVLGIDAEPAEPLEVGVLEVVTTPSERDRLAIATFPLAGTVVFSAKESFYKCWSAAGGPWLEFDDVEVDLAPAGSFVARPRVGGGWSGRWRVVDGFVVTAAWVLAP